MSTRRFGIRSFHRRHAGIVFCRGSAFLKRLWHRRPLSDTEREALLAKTKEATAKGEYELFKTCSIFDSTATNQKWLGEEPERITELPG